MAISASTLYARFPECHKMDFDAKDLARSLETKQLYFCQTKEQSRQINDLRTNAIIVSASGMMTGGRILHHLYNRLPRPNDTLLIPGYQAVGTRGRKILDGAADVRIFGQDIPVKCRVTSIAGLSGHADQSELFRWLGGFTKKPKLTFTVHGEPTVMDIFANNIRQKFGWNVIIPEYLENVMLFEGI